MHVDELEDAFRDFAIKQHRKQVIEEESNESENLESSIPEELYELLVKLGEG